MTVPAIKNDPPKEQPSLSRDLKRLAKKVKKYWWLGMVLGLVCHFVPPDYKEACRAIVSACTP